MRSHTQCSNYMPMTLLVFHASARVDCMTKREISPQEVREHFEGRLDFLYYRHVTYGDDAAEKSSSEETTPITRIVEKFHPNPDLPANQDVAERHFTLADNRIKVVYQLEEGRITASTVEFQTPPLATDQTVILTYDPEKIHTYQV